MTEKRTKDRIKEVKKELRELREMYGRASITGVTDLEVIKEISRQIQDNERELLKLLNQYKRVE